MSKIAVSSPASGTATYTISAPAGSTDRTLTLPDSTGTVLNDQSNIEAQVKTATNASGSAPIYSCRAWCNFNGTGTVAIRASGNVSSITDNGTGIYTANFTTAMPDANYSTVVAAQKFDTTNNGDTIATLGATNQAYSTTAVNFVVRTVNSDTRVDSPIVCVAVFR